MDLTTILGLIIGFGALAYGYTMDGGVLTALYLPSALVIVIGGTIGAVVVSYGASQLKNFFKLFFSIFTTPKSKAQQTIDFLVKLSESARKEGLLSLEKIIEAESQKGYVDPLLKRGALMVIDGVDLDQIRDLLETEVYLYEQKTKSDISMFESASAYAPAMGMIGTIMGLIQVLANMTTPEQLTKSIAVAFITTFYGVILANIFFSPAASKLKARLADYRTEKDMIIEGVCGIRNGENPKMLREKLTAYIQFTTKIKKTDTKKAQGGEPVVKAKERGR